MTAPIHIGLLGAGSISDTHARAALEIPGVTITAVYGRNFEKARRLAGLYGGTAFDSLESFLDHRPMDLVAIGSPSALHGDQGIAAVQRGLHVLIEKPLDITTAKADELIAAADRAGVKLGVFFQDRLKPDVVTLKAMIDAGVLGRPVLASGHVRWYRPPEYYGGSRWRGTFALDGGGALINQAIHTVDLMLHVFGPIASLDARVGTQLHTIEVEDTVVATLQFKNGALGVFQASTAVFPGYARRVELTGSNGTATLEHDNLSGIDLKEPDARFPPPVAATGSGAAANAASPIVGDAPPHPGGLHQRHTDVGPAGVRRCRRTAQRCRRRSDLCFGAGAGASYNRVRQVASATQIPHASAGFHSTGDRVRSREGPFRSADTRRRHRQGFLWDPLPVVQVAADQGRHVVVFAGMRRDVEYVHHARRMPGMPTPLAKHAVHALRSVVRPRPLVRRAQAAPVVSAFRRTVN